MRERLLWSALAVVVTGPTVIAFFAGGFFDKPRLIAGIVVWALAALVAVTAPQALPRSTPGRMALAGLLLLCVWTGVSIVWAPIGGRAQDDLQRLLLYLGFFFCALALTRERVARRWLEVVLAAGVFVVACYALSARLLPDLVHQHHSVTAEGRLEQPLSYWNALGLLAAMGLVLTVRIAGDPERPRALRCAAAAAGVPIGMAVYLTYSRGALAAVAAGLIVLVALAPRGRPMLRSIVAVIGASAVASLIATRFSAVKSLDVHEQGDATGGAVVLAVLVVLALAAAAIVWLRPRRTIRGPTLPVSRPAAVFVATGAAVLVAGVAVAVLEGKPQGTSPTIGASPSRLGSVDTNRFHYWQVAAETWADHPLIGIGSGGFLVPWLQERNRVDTSGDAHSLYLETPAELGLVGLAALLLFLGGIVAACVRLYRLDASAAAGPVAVLAAFAVHAGLDWDWEMPGVSLVALLAAAAVVAWSEGRTGRESVPGVTAEADGLPRRPAELDLAEFPRRSARNPRMRTTKAVLVFVLTFALALPAAALAQSAGDEQYVDPFQNSAGGGGGGGGGGNGGGSNGGQSNNGSANAGQTGSSPSSSSGSGDVAGSDASDTTSGGDGSALPRTGLPLAPVVLAGALLLGGGVTLRRRA